MSLGWLEPTGDSASVGEEMHRLITRLYPICRSITGQGVRETLEIVRSYVPLAVREVPSGTPVFDWTVPKEWNIQDAYVRDGTGRKVIDFQRSSLHVMSYSRPIRARMSLAELRPHLFSLPQFPQWVPYRTSYYNENWGFCLSHEDLLALEEGEYEVCIDSSLEDGHLTYGELYLPGECPDEVLLSCHICHPSLCNDNLSGVALATFLARTLAGRQRRYSYRFLFIPGTIGSIAWLSANEDRVSRIKHGLVLTCVGDAAPPTYKKSRRGNAEIDRAAVHVLKHRPGTYQVREFTPYGYDERQFCSPGFNLPVGCLMRSAHGEFPEYHTSADNLHLVQPQALLDSFAICTSMIFVLEKNGLFLNTNPKCEPRLGKRGLYRSLGGALDEESDEMALLWVLNLSDGTNTLLDTAERAGLPFSRIRKAADALLAQNLLREMPTSA